MLPLFLLAAGQAAGFPSPVVDVRELDFYKREVPNDTITIPSPAGHGGAWSDSFQRAQDLVGQMTLEEKAKIATGQDGRCVGNTAGIDRLGLPALCLEDGPAGVRPIVGVTQFPAGLTTACTWDKDLMYQRSKAMGQEFYDVGVHIALAPVTGGPLGRAPLNGRNWEGSFADPYGTGVYSYQSVKGLQDAGVAACSKHWIGYEQETDRRPFFDNPPDFPVDSHIDDQATHELYMWGFAEAVRAGSAHMMCSYNSVNGSHACSDDYSLNYLLKGELNFQGSVISDWGGAWDSVETALGGQDMLQPGTEGLWNTTLIDLVTNGTIPEARLDDQIARILAPYFWLGQADTPLPSVPFNAPDFAPEQLPAEFRQVQKPSTLKLIKKIGEDGAVLLKNEGGLPLKNPQNIAVLGEDAGPNRAGAVACGDAGDHCPDGNVNGTMTIGYGSGYAYPNNLITPLAGIQYRALQDGNFRVVSSLDNSNLLNISSTAADVDTAIVFASAWAGEGQDRTDFKLDYDGENVILAAASQCNNTIVVLHIPGAVDVESWIDHPNITAVIAPMLPGEQSGMSLPPLLFGDVSPSGKLVFTMAKSPEDYPPNTIVDQPVHAPTSVFNESLNIDYRWFDKNNIEPRYPFGYGLSYSTFDYSGLKVQKQYKADDKAIQKTAEPFYEYDGSNSLYDEVVSVSVDVKNTGSVVACEVAQLYIGFPEETEQPPWQLRGFEKIQQLEPGQTTTVTFTLRRKDVSTWRTVEQRWQQAEKIQIGVGAHSRALDLKQTLSL